MTDSGTRNRRLAGALPALCAVVLGLSACGGSSTGNPTATPAPSSAQPSTQPGSATPAACTLLNAQDATTLNGSAMTNTTGDSSGIGCTFAGAGGPGVSGVEITVRVDSDAATAHADFPRWVQPVPGALPPGFTITPESGIGDEASETHSGTTLDGIFFRHGAVLIKIGCYPPASDAALQAAANTVLGRL